VGGPVIVDHPVAKNPSDMSLVSWDQPVQTIDASRRSVSTPACCYPSSRRDSPWSTSPSRQDVRSARASASLDTLLRLMDIDPKEDLRSTRDANGHAYDLIVDIRRYYKAELTRRGLTSADALRTYYDRFRLAILTGILRTTPCGYRASDARCIIGAIYWEQRKTADALQSWRDMTMTQRTDTSGLTKTS
jgi:hypothetical protein